MASQLILIDAKNFLYRHAATHSGLSSDGFPTGALYGCPVAMLSLAKKFPGTSMVFVWDGAGTTWRHKLLSRHRSPKIENPIAEAAKINVPAYMQSSFDFLEKSNPLVMKPRSPGVTTTIATKVARPVGYKAHREAHHDSAPYINVAVQLPVFRSFLQMLGIRQYQVDCLEGDDLIGAMVTWIDERRFFDEIIIHSSDKDFYQFISDTVKVYRSLKEGGFVDVATIEAESNCLVADLTKVKALTGEITDNIPHLWHGVGPKTAAKWLKLGLDPSLESWLAMPERVRRQLHDLDLKYDLRKRWEEVHKNYLASQVIRTHDHPYLDSKVSRELKQLLEKLSRDTLVSDKKKRTKETWRKLTEFLAQYQMQELLTRREELWQLP